MKEGRSQSTCICYSSLNEAKHLIQITDDCTIYHAGGGRTVGVQLQSEAGGEGEEGRGARAEGEKF